MKHSLKRGFSFGLASGIITTLGLMVGLNSATSSRFVVLGGILTIAIADALSDALGMHVSVEFSGVRSFKHIWEATFATFFSKFFFALTFAVPVLLFSLPAAILINIVWGFFLLSVFSFFVAKKQNIAPWKAVFEHLIIAVIVIIATYYVGRFVALYFV